MKAKLIQTTILTIWALVGEQATYPQGTFQNLNFENPTPPRTGPAGLASITNALPGGLDI